MSEQTASEQARDGWRTFAMPSAVTVAALGVLVLDSLRPLPQAAVLMAVATVLAALGCMGLAFRKNLRMLAGNHGDASTDALTSLGNRRRLIQDLEDGISNATVDHPLLLITLDLDGFKRYNDTFGHVAGDALLARLGGTLGESVRGVGKAYRLGGDEFCALAVVHGRDIEPLVAGVVASLAEEGGGYTVSTSHGTVRIPEEARTAERALQNADQRLYANKSWRKRAVAAHQTHEALARLEAV